MAKTERSSIQSKVKSLVVCGCSHHQTMGPFGMNNYCFIREKNNHGICVFFSALEAPRCSYFENFVLPLDKDLKAVFSNELLNLEIREGQKRLIRKRCERPGCLKIFLAKSNAQRFCPECQRAAYRDKARAWDRVGRKNPESMSQSAK